MNRTEFRNQKLLLRELINPAAVFSAILYKKEGASLVDTIYLQNGKGGI